MLNSLTSRLNALQQVVAALVVMIFAGSSLLLTHHAVRRQETLFLREAARRVAENLAKEAADEGGLDRGAADMLDEDQIPGVRVDIYDPKGQLVASTGRAASRWDSAGLAGLATGAAGSSGRAVERSAGGATVVVSSSSRLQETILAALGRALVLAALPLLLGTIVTSRWLTRRALKPLAAMERQAEDASVDRGMRSLGAATGIEEIDSLRGSFNRLLERLDDLLQHERRFTAEASHELRTPLTVLSGELEIALSDAALPSEVRPGLERALEQARGLRDLVEALLLLRRAEESKAGDRAGFEPVNLSDVAREVAEDARCRHGDRAHDLRVSAPDEALVSGHPVLLASALRNLIDNALKFTLPGDPIFVTVTDAEGVRVVVEDGGPGIAAGLRERVFDPFYRGPEARAEGGGIGLGLPIIREVARAHGGDVVVGDSPLGGARFDLRLPAWGRRPPVQGLFSRSSDNPRETPSERRV